jgi:hypothetical protein
LIAVACNSNKEQKGDTQEKAKKAQQLIKDYLRKNLNHPETYEPGSCGMNVLVHYYFCSGRKSTLHERITGLEEVKDIVEKL